MQNKWIKIIAFTIIILYMVVNESERLENGRKIMTVRKEIQTLEMTIARLNEANKEILQNYINPKPKECKKWCRNEKKN